MLSASSFFGLQSLSQNGPEWLGYGRLGTWAVWAMGTTLSSLTGLVIVGGNYVIKFYVYAATERERHISKTSFERSLFTKLSVAYLANTVALPFLIGLIPHGVSQSWYEAGGALDEAQVVLVSTVLIGEALKVSQPWSLIKRRVLARRAHSQLRLNALWSPPPMKIGELFADAIRTLGLCFMYAPIYPPLYLLASLGLLANLLGNKFALSYWWASPPCVGQEMMERLRLAIWLLMPLQFGVGALATWRAAHDRGFVSSGLPSLLLSCALWLSYPAVLCVHERLPLRLQRGVEWLRPYDPLRLTTHGLRYDGVRAAKGYEIARYRGLGATRTEESAAQLEERALKAGLAGLGAVAALTAVRQLAQQRREAATRCGAATAESADDGDEQRAPTEEEFIDPLAFVHALRPETTEQHGGGIERLGARLTHAANLLVAVWGHRKQVPSEPNEKTAPSPQGDMPVAAPSDSARASDQSRRSHLDAYEA